MNESETNSMDIDYVSNLARIELTDDERKISWTAWRCTQVLSKITKSKCRRS